MSNDSQQTFTLDEAAKELRRRECRQTGHDWTFAPLRLVDEAPQFVLCDRCGWQGRIVMGDKP